MTERAASAADATRLDVGARTLNLCTMVVSVCDVFDALRSNRVHAGASQHGGIGGGDADPSGRSFRPQVKLLTDGKGEKLETPLLTNTWDRDSRGGFARAIVEAVDGPQVGIDALAYL